MEHNNIAITRDCRDGPAATLTKVGTARTLADMVMQKSNGSELLRHHPICYHSMELDDC